MNIETIFALVCSAILIVYLVYALLRPEKPLVRSTWTSAASSSAGVGMRPPK